MRYDNAPAIALYEKCGYRPFGEHEDYYTDGATALRYKKILVAGCGGTATVSVDAVDDLMSVEPQGLSGADWLAPPDESP